MRNAHPKLESESGMCAPGRSRLRRAAVASLAIPLAAALFGALPDPAVAAYVVLPEEYRQAAVLPGAFEQARLSYDWLNIAVILLTAITLGQEFAWGTARTILARGPGRIRLLIARFLALAAMVGFYLLTLWIASGILGMFPTRGLEGAADWPFWGAPFLAQQGAALIRTWAIILPVIAIAMFLTVWIFNGCL